MALLEMVTRLVGEPMKSQRAPKAPLPLRLIGWTAACMHDGDKNLSMDFHPIHFSDFFCPPNHSNTVVLQMPATTTSKFSWWGILLNVISKGFSICSSLQMGLVLSSQNSENSLLNFRFGHYLTTTLTADTESNSA